MMSRKYLIFIIIVMIVGIGAVSAADNSTDKVALDSNVSVVSANSDNEPALASSYDDYEDDYEVDYYDKAVLKPTKMKTTYNSGKTFKVKAVSSKDKTYTLDSVRLKATVYNKNGHKNYYAYTDYDGVARFKLSKLSLGYHKVVVKSADPYTSSKKVTSYVKIYKAKTKVSAPKVTAKYKKSKTFKIKIRDKANNKVVKKVKISVKVGKKKYTLKTNSKGVASFKTKSLRPGTYKVTIKSKNSKYKIYAKSKIVIKKVHRKSSGKKTSSYGGGSYVASANSDKFHYSSCGYASRIKSYNKITFSSRSDAISAGYSPCSRCHP